MLGPFLGAIAAWRTLAGEKGIRTLFRHLLRPWLSDWKGWLGGLIPLGYFGVLIALFFIVLGVGTV